MPIQAAEVESPLGTQLTGEVEFSEGLSEWRISSGQQVNRLVTYMVAVAQVQFGKLRGVPDYQAQRCVCDVQTGEP